MSDRAAAYEDWKSGMKYKEIAEKYGVSESAVKSWVNRYFKPQKEKEVAGKVATKGKKKLQPFEEKLQPKKPGAPMGNRNAKGNAGGGAPAGNQNRLTHGAYCKVFDDLFTDKERTLAESMDFRKLTLLKDEILVYTMRERKLLERIAKYEAVPTGLAIRDVTKEGKKTTTGAVTTFEFIRILEAELTKVQRAKANNIRMLYEFVEEDKDEDSRQDALEFIGALGGQITDGWED